MATRDREETQEVMRKANKSQVRTHKVSPPQVPMPECNSRKTLQERSNRLHYWLQCKMPRSRSQHNRPHNKHPQEDSRKEPQQGNNKEQLDHKQQQVPRDRKARKEHQEQEVHQEQEELQVLQVRKDRKVS